jgi:hypothetical protein
MGEIAEAAVNGETCEFLCGTWFKKAHGHPVVCKSCWKSLPRSDREGHVQAYEKELA